jgi:hypothetical protein
MKTKSSHEPRKRIERLERLEKHAEAVAAAAAAAALAGGGVLTNFSYFYGLTTGTGNVGSNDYAATVAVKTAAGTGRVPFPRNGATNGGLLAPTRVDTSSFTIPEAGIYLVQFFLHTTEPGQLQIELDGVDIADSVAVNANPTSGGHPLVGASLITVTAGQVLAIINCPGNAAALTVTPADGNLTAANAGRLIIARIGTT